MKIEITEKELRQLIRKLEMQFHYRQNDTKGNVYAGFGNSLAGIGYDFETRRSFINLPVTFDGMTNVSRVYLTKYRTYEAVAGAIDSIGVELI